MFDGWVCPNWHLSRHEVAEAAGLISYSFGVDDDKYIILFRKVLYVKFGTWANGAECQAPRSY